MKFTARDRYEGVLDLVFSVEVTPVNDPPTLTLPEGVLSLPEGGEMRIPETEWVTDPDPEETFTWRITSRDGHIKGEKQGGELIITLNEGDWHGEDALVIVVTDTAGLFAQEERPIIVTSVSEAPRFLLTAHTFPEDEVSTLLLSDLV